MNLTLIAGARPNFMKIAPIIHAIQKAQQGGINIHYRLVHTGQHYDVNMSKTFFEELDIPRPDVNLGCGGGTQAEQTAAIMIAFEKDLMANPTDLVIVVGDVTSTMACSIVAKKNVYESCSRGSRYQKLGFNHAERNKPYGHRHLIRLLFYHFRNGKP